MQSFADKRKWFTRVIIFSWVGLFDGCLRYHSWITEWTCSVNRAEEEELVQCWLCWSCWFRMWKLIRIQTKRNKRRSFFCDDVIFNWIERSRAGVADGNISANACKMALLIFSYFCKLHIRLRNPIALIHPPFSGRNILKPSLSETKFLSGLHFKYLAARF